MTVAIMNYFAPAEGQLLDVPCTAGVMEAIPLAVGDRWTTLSVEGAQRLREMTTHAQTQPRRDVTATPLGTNPRFL